MPAFQGNSSLFRQTRGMRSEHQLVRLPPPSLWLRLLEQLCWLKAVLWSDWALLWVAGTHFHITSVLCNSHLREDLSPSESRGREDVGDCYRDCRGSLSVPTSKEKLVYLRYLQVGLWVACHWAGGGGREGLGQKNSMTWPKQGWACGKSPSWTLLSYPALETLYYTIQLPALHSGTWVTWGSICPPGDAIIWGNVPFPHWHRDSQGQPWRCVSLVKSCSSYGQNRSSLKRALDLERRGTSHSRTS